MSCKLSLAHTWLLQWVSFFLSLDWFGVRSPSPVLLSDGFKCSRCDYADSCDDRVEKYKRVGRLIRDTPPTPPKADDTKSQNNEEKMEVSITSGNTTTASTMTIPSLNSSAPSPTRRVKKQKKDHANGVKPILMDLTSWSRIVTRCLLELDRVDMKSDHITKVDIIPNITASWVVNMLVSPSPLLLARQSSIQLWRLHRHKLKHSTSNHSSTGTATAMICSTTNADRCHRTVNDI